MQADGHAQKTLRRSAVRDWGGFRIGWLAQVPGQCNQNRGANAGLLIDLPARVLRDRQPWSSAWCGVFDRHICGTLSDATFSYLKIFS
jgi:hypothetical protein